MRPEPMAHAIRVVRRAVRELAASGWFDPAEAARYAAVADRLGSLESAEPDTDDRSNREVDAASPVVVMAGRAAVSLVELLAGHLTVQGTAGRWADSDLVELAKLLPQGRTWRLPETGEGRSQQFPETGEGRSQQSPRDGSDDIAPSPRIASGAR